jgi:hypothetical protein
MKAIKKSATTTPNEPAASMRGLSVRKVVGATKMETKFKDKIC